MLWAPLRKPHENALDPHWMARHSVTDIPHPELGRSFRYATSKWLGTATSWSVGRRAPLLNEDAQTVTASPTRGPVAIDAEARWPVSEKLSPHGKPFPLHGIRILDFTWFLASAGGTRFLTARLCCGAPALPAVWKTRSPSARFFLLCLNRPVRHVSG